MLYSYLRFTDRVLDVFFFLLAVILSELYEKPRRKIELPKKLHGRTSERDISFYLRGSLGNWRPLPPSVYVSAISLTLKRLGG